MEAESLRVLGGGLGRCPAEGRGKALTRPRAQVKMPTWQAPGKGLSGRDRCPMAMAGLDKSARPPKVLPILVGLVVRRREGRVFGTGPR